MTPPPTLSSSSYSSSSSSRVTQNWLPTGPIGLIAHRCKELSLRCHFQVSSGTHPDTSAGCKTAVSHHSALPSAEVKNAWHIKWKRNFKLEIVLRERAIWRSRVNTVRSFRSYPKMIRELWRERHTLLAPIRDAEIRNGSSTDKPWVYKHHVLSPLVLQEIAERNFVDSLHKNIFHSGTWK